MCRHIAKLRLLERGLLEAAQGVEDIQLRVRRRKAKAKAGEDEGDVEGDVGLPDETPLEFMTRINLYVAIHLSRVKSSTRNDYKDAMVYQARKEVINEFLKNTILKKCQNVDCNSCVVLLFVIFLLTLLFI